jgi:hypothetical protein
LYVLIIDNGVIAYVKWSVGLFWWFMTSKQPGKTPSTLEVRRVEDRVVVCPRRWRQKEDSIGKAREAPTSKDVIRHTTSLITNTI